jgi:HAD superfamily hydrolase (TIGR01493 family)
MTGITPRAYVFDAYGTLFDVHAAISRHRAAAGPDADRFSEIWRLKQLEYSWTLTLAGRYVDFWTLTASSTRFPTRVPRLRRLRHVALMSRFCPTVRRICSTPPSRRPA